MPIEIPESFGQFSVSGIQSLIEQAQVEYSTLKESVTASSVTDEELERLRELQTFIRVDGPNEITSRQRRQAEFAALDSEPEAPADEEAAEPAPEPEPVTASTTSTPDEVIKVKLSDITPAAGNSVEMVPEARPVYST